MQAREKEHSEALKAGRGRRQDQKVKRVVLNRRDPSSSKIQDRNEHSLRSVEVIFVFHL